MRGAATAAVAFVAVVVLGASLVERADLAPRRSSPNTVTGETVEVDLRSAPALSRRGGRGASIEPDPAWVADVSGRTGIPGPALRAYARADLQGGGGCGVTWPTLAALGWVESLHGTLDGRRLRKDGRPSRPVIGPALDGTGDVAAIPASPASAALHGDRVWEHAVGPLQFLPSTWEVWGTDGDGNGSADVHDLDDAAAAAAAYLCVPGTDLTTGAGWSAAVLTYNHSAAYVAAVSAAASRYAENSRH